MFSSLFVPLAIAAYAFAAASPAEVKLAALRNAATQVERINALNDSDVSAALSAENLSIC